MDLISVIVPVYKVEPYLDRCVQSIVDQTYRNLEIILVDDGSPDRCGQMCDAWAEKDSRIKVIHKENGGLSDARNAGMAAATGGWIAFVDSDDWIAADMYEVLLNAASDAGVQVAVCKYASVYPDREFPSIAYSMKVKTMDRTDAMRALIRDGEIRQVVWNKLYRRIVVAEIPFAAGKLHEDEFWTYQVIAKIERLAVVDYAGYFYLQRDTSIMGQTFSLKRLDAVEAKCLRHALIEAQIPELINDSLSSIWGTCLYQGQCALRQMKGEERKSVLDDLKNVQKEHPLPKEKPAQISKKYWLWFRLAGMLLTLTCRVRNALKIGL